MNKTNSLYKRIEKEIHNYISSRIEVSPKVYFSQYQTVNRLYRFKNRDLSGTKINPDLSYNYYFDIISPRVDSEIKNLRLDTKNILIYSQSPRKDFPAVFLANASLKSWMAENGEDEKLKEAVEQFVSDGNIIFKRVAGGYERVDPLNCFITNQQAKTIDELDIIERHELTASEIKRMSEWNEVVSQEVIEECGNKSFTSAPLTTSIESSKNSYEIFEYTGEMSEQELYEVQGKSGGDPNNYILGKVIVAGLRKDGKGEKYCLFAEQLQGKLSDWYKSAHRGKYEGRFWRTGMYEVLFDHQVRANEIGNQLAKGLDWASKVVFHSTDSNILSNIRADLENGDVIIGKDLKQVDVRLHNVDQLIADWNRLMTDADRVSNSLEVVRGEAMPSNTPFRLGALLNQNAGLLYVFLRQKIALPYRKVFREWVLPELIKEMKGKDIFRFVGDAEILDQLREVIAESWYISNLVQIGPHTREMAEAIKAEKVDELRKIDPVIQNTKEIWKSVRPRLFVTITGENSDQQDQVQDLINLVNLEQDPERRNWMLDTIYRIRGIPVPPRREEAPPETQILEQKAFANTQQKNKPKQNDINNLSRSAEQQQLMQ